MLPLLIPWFDSWLAQSKNFCLSQIPLPRTAMSMDIIWCMHNLPVISWDPFPPSTWLPNLPPPNGTCHLLWGVWDFVQVSTPSLYFNAMSLPSLFITGSAIQWPHCHTGLAVFPSVDRGVTDLLCCLLELAKLIWNHISEYNSLYAAP